MANATRRLSALSAISGSEINARKAVLQLSRIALSRIALKPVKKLPRTEMV